MLPHGWKGVSSRVLFYTHNLIMKDGKNRKSFVSYIAYSSFVCACPLPMQAVNNKKTGGHLPAVEQGVEAPKH